MFLFTSAEHYGSALNPDFDYIAHLDVLQACGFNQCRVFSGFYVEGVGDHNIMTNTLAPVGERFLAPWARSDEPGYVYGGNKFDLDRWDERFWARLKDILQAAGKRGILFCMEYGDSIWKASPLHRINNIQNEPEVHWQQVYHPENTALRARMEQLVEKFLIELNGFDNFYYEIGNEVYYNDTNRSFLDSMAAFIAEKQAALPRQHLVAVNVSNYSMQLLEPIPGVDIHNFHYANATAVAENYHLGLPTIDDETGFKGNETLPYRKEAWEFMLAGGSGFSHLDYAFTVDKPDGTHEVEATTPGIGGPAWRKELKVLLDFLKPLEIWKMQPRNDLVRVLWVPPEVRIQVLARPGEVYAAYLYGKAKQDWEFCLEVEPGTYLAEWIDPASGRVVQTETISWGYWGAVAKLPHYEIDVALRVTRE